MSTVAVIINQLSVELRAMINKDAGGATTLKEANEQCLRLMNESEGPDGEKDDCFEYGDINLD